MVYRIVALSSNLGYTPPVPVYMLPPFFIVAIPGIPVVISLMLSTMSVVAFIYSLFSLLKRKLIFSIELLILLLNVMMIAFRTDGVANEGLLFMLIVAAIQAGGSVIFITLVYACNRKNTDKIYYMTKKIYYYFMFYALLTNAEIGEDSSQ